MDIMGLSDFLKKKPDSSAPMLAAPNPAASVVAKPQASRPQILTVTAPKELFPAYDEAFFAEMNTIKAFGKEDVSQMHRLITEGEGGFLNQGRYHRLVFDTFFADHDWRWPWFEKWDETFKQFGEYPNNFPRKQEARPAVPPVTSIEVLRKDQMQQLLETVGIAYLPDAKKKDLAAAALATPETRKLVEGSPLWAAIDSLCPKLPAAYGTYTMLMRTIHCRATALHGRRRCKQLGITQFKLTVPDKANQRFVDLALREKPQSLTPLYPGDTSLWSAIVPGFE